MADQGFHSNLFLKHSGGEKVAKKDCHELNFSMLTNEAKKFLTKKKKKNSHHKIVKH